MLNPSNIHRCLNSLLKEKFFNPCEIHDGSKMKNIKKIFCVDCCVGICPHCLSHHTSHCLLQIRRYLYHDVITLRDAEKLLDCGFVQSYTTNRAKVVFLNERARTRPCRGTSNRCFSCYRPLQHPFLFCSISCKLSKHLHHREHITAASKIVRKKISFPIIPPTIMNRRKGAPRRSPLF